MWWCSGGSDRLSRAAHVVRRRAVVAPVLLLLLSPLAACGFHPLYAESQTTAYEPALAAVSVLPIANRIGQQLELSLREAFNPRGASAEQRYQLSVTLTISRIDLGIQRDATATRGRVDVFAAMVLIEAKTQKILYRSQAQSTSAFNILTDGFAAQVAEEDARTRTVRDLTEEIRTRLTFFLRQHAA
jgi:LPS-assembly lipoprotein